MAFIRDLVFRKKDITEYPHDVVVEVKHDDYQSFQPYERQDCLVLYGLQEKCRYEILLQKATFNRGVEVDFSLCRFFSEEDAFNAFRAMEKKLPNLCNHQPDLINPNTLKDLVCYMRSHPRQTLAHICAYFGFLDTIKKLVDDDPSIINTPDPDTGVVPIHLAIMKSRLPVVQYLISLNCDLALADGRGWNIFHFAATTNREIIAALCASSEPLQSSVGASTAPSLKSPSSPTSPPLSTQRSVSEHKMLITKLINSRNFDKNCPLFLACHSDKPECVIEMLKNGADGDGASLETSENKEPESGIDQNPDFVQGHIIDQLDPKVMRLGGSALHWAKSQQCIEALLEMGLNMNRKNFHGETVFHCMVSKKNLACIVTLLSHGVDVNAIGPNGETPLHLAVKTGEVTIVQALVVFGADLNICNNSGETARHMVATNRKIPNQDQILYILDTVGAKRCQKQNSPCTDGCAANANYNGIPPENSPLGRIVRIYENFYREILESALKRKRERELNLDQPINQNQVRLLSLDGGGIKGLILAQMLSILEDMTKRRTHDLFNWFSGTSTGAILAIYLALGNSAAQSRRLYFRLKDKIFFGSRPYDSEPLEKFVQKEFGFDTKLSDIQNVRLMVTATKADRFPVDLHLFRNYPSPDEIIRSSEEQIKVHQPCTSGIETPLWMIARCSGAAPTYFRPCGAFLDGGLIANNPTLDVLTEISQLNAAYSHVGKPEQSLSIDVVVSCGCGSLPVKTVSIIDVYRPDSLYGVAKMAFMASALGELLVEQATQADGAVVERAKAWCHGIKVPYFRLNPPISDQISLDETNNVKIINMLWETTVYMYNRKSELQELIYLLS